ncbi:MULTISPECIES: type I DNA topoisomerase [Alteromonas]|jgi:DNA topoisomerase-1|uniref:DNA topoisomerase 1 n=1 Tax=Alteromonas stellipolaris TaxID=233316 RepID=A0AAW7Z7N2_9ALTE|nr:MULTISPECIES: type I DNA topoisomerase [Alteromonas]AMJ90237.1 DNA topoisomerase I subunit omega [Alteromonas sp. Mac2]ALM90912.1 DNA topoisomerase I [Alteromonas stellipolaris LMG 21856]AMJ73949.1 DNA topoisomerase I subunit omega [Alteromonas stellipolaris]AMJ86378.1 DNA topoisomerase I subunit omega [Alteromonas sp. Mac1]AMJ94083.1 DNA topoisomerase I subunit omega [Alteromonas stellipolaris]
MAKSLVIVESPAKAKTINKYLGKDFIVKSSVGHVRDLPTKALGKVEPKKPAKELKTYSEEDKQEYLRRHEYLKLVDRMGVDPEQNWKAHYQVLQGKEKVVNELKRLAKDADTIYLATDLDREGEAIAWHLQELLGSKGKTYQRVVFNEITKNAIQEAFSDPGEVNVARVNAQQARRFLDRVVGFMVSPLLWKKIARGLSAGRVQSVAVRLVVDREREIKAFVPEEFWDIHADLTSEQKAALRMLVAKHEGKAFKPVNKAQADKALEDLNGAKYLVESRESKPTSSRPSAPFITSTLQQAASTRLGFGVKKTMMMAQRLYEAGYITYMRTDSTNLSQEALDNCRAYIEDNFGSKYLPESPNRYGSKEGAQEAHEAIRPSSVKVNAAHLGDMERDAQRLYELIWRQFVACQMTPAKYDATTIRVGANNYELTAKGRVLKFDGWTRVQPQLRKKGEEELMLPDVQKGDVLNLNALDPKQHFTKPVARFNEASLVKELEKRGIGRPSTYASIISTIQDRGYVRLENKRFYAEKMGEIVNDRLMENFDDLMSFDFTANMEQQLDDIAEGNKDWKDVLNLFYSDFYGKLLNAEKAPEEGGMRLNQAIPSGITCDKCGREMNVRTASTGVFLGCSGYNLPPKERCTNTMNLTPGDEVVKVDDEEELETEALRAKKRCPICSTAMDSYLVDETRKLHVCGNTPTCEGTLVETGTFKIKGYDGPIIECDKCGSDMELKNGRFGKYFGCTNEECKNTRKLLRNGEAAPPKEDPVDLPELPCEKSDAHFVLRDGASGIFMAAHNFPKSRETRAPKVEELARFRDRISEKFYYLADAPQKDPEGNLAIVRYSRKTKQQYVMSENEAGKATGWSAWYNDGKWETQAASKPAAKTKAKAKKK